MFDVSFLFASYSLKELLLKHIFFRHYLLYILKISIILFSELAILLTFLFELLLDLSLFIV